MAENAKKIVTQSTDVGDLLKLLPSDIFPVDKEVVHVSEPKHNSSSSSSQVHQLSCMAANRRLTQRLGALSRVEPTPPPSSNQRNSKPLPNFEWVRYDVPCFSVGPSPPPPGVVPLWCLVCDASTGCYHGVFDPRTGSFCPLLIPVYTCPVYVPVQTSAGGSGGGGGGGVGGLQTLQSQQNSQVGRSGGGVEALQNQQNSQVSDRILPLPCVGTSNGGGSVKDNGGGTGVFLPRKTASISSTAANNNTALARKRQGPRNRRKAQFLPKKNCTIPADSKKQEDCLTLLPSELNLPIEWTY